MIHRIRVGVLFACVAVGALVGGCSHASSTSATSGSCPNALVSRTSDAYPSDQQPIYATQGVAESFVLAVNQSILGVSLRLKGVSSTSPSSLSGTLTVYIVPDAANGTTPTQPNCSAANGGSGCASSAVASGTLDLSEVSTTAPGNYLISLSLTNSSTNQKPYWIVATTGTASGSANYVAWDGSTYSGNTDFLTYTASTFGLGNSQWTQQNQDMSFQLCD